MVSFAYCTGEVSHGDPNDRTVIEMIVGQEPKMVWGVKEGYRVSGTTQRIPK